MKIVNNRSKCKTFASIMDICYLISQVNVYGRSRRTAKTMHAGIHKSSWVQWPKDDYQMYNKEFFNMEIKPK